MNYYESPRYGSDHTPSRWFWIAHGLVWTWLAVVLISATWVSMNTSQQEAARDPLNTLGASFLREYIEPDDYERTNETLREYVFNNWEER